MTTAQIHVFFVFLYRSLKMVRQGQHLLNWHEILYKLNKYNMSVFLSIHSLTEIKQNEIHAASHSIS